MLFTRINGRYSIEAVNICRKDFLEGLARIGELLKEEVDGGEDVLLVTDVTEQEGGARV